MSKQHRDFVQYVRNSVAINALVAFSRDVYTPATQTVPAFTQEHLTVVYLDPGAANAGVVATGEQLRSSIKIEFDVAPLAEGKVNGWKEAEGVDELDRTKALLAEAEDLVAQYEAASAKASEPTPPPVPAAGQPAKPASGPEVIQVVPLPPGEKILSAKQQAVVDETDKPEAKAQPAEAEDLVAQYEAASAKAAKPAPAPAPAPDKPAAPAVPSGEKKQ